jgi:hypothetical protein
MVIFIILISPLHPIHSRTLYTRAVLFLTHRLLQEGHAYHVGSRLLGGGTGGGGGGNWSTPGDEGIGDIKKEAISIRRAYREAREKWAIGSGDLAHR